MTTTTMFRSLALLALPLVLAACGKTDSAASASTDDAGAATDAAPVGPPGTAVVRTVEERSPFGNLSVPDNLVLDGDFVRADGTTHIGEGVLPDEDLMPKQSDLLAGKDTVFLRALEWVRTGQ